MNSPRLVALVDLDDTLFQTARKMPEGTPRYVATLDVDGQPNGYMSAVQQSFAQWLFSSVDVVPVTARSVEAYSRVQLPFTHGAICSHGGAILDPDGKHDHDWQARMHEVLDGFQQRLPDLSQATLAIGKALGISLRGWVVQEQGLHNYVVTKHNETHDDVLATVLAEVQAQGLLEGMHVHANSNNLAFLPQGLSKRIAVQEWLRRDRQTHGERPVLGFGDSITDLGFMGECHMWATPSHSQLARLLSGVVNG